MPKQPQAAFESVFAFSPNRATLGGTSYLILKNDAGDNTAPHGDGDQNVGESQVGTAGNCLVDCPPWTDETRAFLQGHGGVRWLVITHRDAIAGLKVVREIQAEFHCEVLIQEQEAYLLPGIDLTPFHREQAIAPDLEILWTPGYSPGASCVYLHRHGGVLFSGRHLLPTPKGDLRPQQQPKTFHWPRQLRSVEALRSRFTAETLAHCCPGANVGFLRGNKSVDNAYSHLAPSLEAATP